MYNNNFTEKDLYGLNIGEKNHIIDCYTRKMFKNKKVLEVGGTTPKEITERLNVSSWSCVDPDRASNDISTDNYKQYKCNISEFDKDCDFDLIYSTNCFEHISNLEESITRMYELLKPEGRLSSLAGPIFSSYKGHHTWINTEEYGLIDFNNVKIEKWGHLIYSEEELFNKLTKYYNEKISTKIINQIFHRQSINRLFFDDYVEIINKSKFKIIEFRDWHQSQYPDEETLKKLKKYNKKNFSTVSIKMILEK